MLLLGPYSLRLYSLAPTVRFYSLSGNRFGIRSSTYLCGGLQCGGLQSRATITRDAPKNACEKLCEICCGNLFENLRLMPTRDCRDVPESCVFRVRTSMPRPLRRWHDSPTHPRCPTSRSSSSLGTGWVTHLISVAFTEVTAHGNESTLTTFSSIFSASKPRPVRVRTVPPAALPTDGDTSVMTGKISTWCARPLWF